MQGERLKKWLSKVLAPLALAGAVLSGIAVGAAPLAAAPAAVVTDVRVAGHGATTRFVLDLTAPVTVELFALDNPRRIVLDLSEVGWRLPARPLPNRVGFLDRLRYGLFKPGVTRVVLEPVASATLKDAFLLGPEADGRFRVVVDLAAGAPGSFAALVGEGVRALGTRTDAAAAVFDPGDWAYAPPPRKPDRRPYKPLIVLDPGHGGMDPGAIGRRGTYEKHIVLSAAREFKKMLEASGRFRVVLTRERDRFIPLKERVVFAREAKADLFISVHADSIRNTKVQGASVYTLSETASDAEAAELAERENKADVIAGIDLTHESQEVTSILISLAQRETMNQSSRFAALLANELSKETKTLRNSHRFAGFRVLKAPDVPSVLIELGFLSNSRDETALGRKVHREKLGAAVLRASENFFSRVEEAYRR